MAEYIDVKSKLKNGNIVLENVILPLVTIPYGDVITTEGMTGKVIKITRDSKVIFNIGGE